MIWTFEVHNLELEAFDPAALLGVEQDFNPDCAHWCTRDTRHNTVEGSPAWLQHVLYKAHLVHSVPVQDVDAAPIINENPGELWC